MSKLKEYRDTQQALTENLQRLEALKNNADLVNELEFEKKLMALLKRYSKKTEDLLAFIGPGLMGGLLAKEQRSVYGETARKKTNSSRRKTGKQA